MQLAELLTKQIKNEIPRMHVSRLKAVIDCTKTLFTNKRLTLTDLGRNMAGNAKVRSNIRKVDRLLGNKHLHGEILDFFTVMARHILNKGSRPLILIDWTCLSARRGHYLLRASTSMRGRSMVIYQEVHPKSEENNHETHRKFLKTLTRVIPRQVKPIIVTDAGFRALWFREVKLLGYDFVGRIRNKNAVKLIASDNWVKSYSFYERATDTPQELGTGYLTRRASLSCRFILYKRAKRHRKSKNLKGKERTGSSNKRYAKAHREPWLIVTSLSTEEYDANRVVQSYSKRMQIEEDIRDTKSSRYGLSVALSDTRSRERMAVLLLIGMLATYMSWIAALVAQRRRTAQDYQARSSKFTNALSFVFLGIEVMRRKLVIRKEEYDEAIERLRYMASNWSELKC